MRGAFSTLRVAPCSTCVAPDSSHADHRTRVTGRESRLPDLEPRLTAAESSVTAPWSMVTDSASRFIAVAFQCVAPRSVVRAPDSRSAGSSSLHRGMGKGSNSYERQLGGPLPAIRAVIGFDPLAGYPSRGPRSQNHQTPMRLQPCSNEEQQDFIALHEEIHARFVDYAGKFLGRDDAEDAVAEVMANLWERWATLPPAQRNDRYAFGILRRGIRSRLRSPDRFVGLDEAECELEVQSVRAHDEAIRERENAERHAVVAEVRERELDLMPVRRREVLQLVLEQDLSYREAGEALGLSKGTIAQHMRLALQTLRTALLWPDASVLQLRPQFAEEAVHHHERGRSRHLAPAVVAHHEEAPIVGRDRERSAGERPRADALRDGEEDARRVRREGRARIDAHDVHLPVGGVEELASVVCPERRRAAAA
ncbi:MAG: sigma-70 family RNA polymerase sigma factor [Gemmatimonadetes bacterium]|nr:sigma-70 family RNA polymerase sigma factor [Gemmatimonadota bacterium]